MTAALGLPPEVINYLEELESSTGKGRSKDNQRHTLDDEARRSGGINQKHPPNDEEDVDVQRNGGGKGGGKSGDKGAAKKEDELRFARELAGLPKNSGPGVFTSLLGKLARERRWWDVAAVFAEMKVRSIAPNRIHVNAAINVFAKARRPQAAEEWLIWMQENDMKPNEVSYNSVINACAQAGFVERAEMWLGRMLEAGVAANEVSYNSVINACAQKGKVTRAEMWIEKMIAAGVRADAFSYNTIINACAQRRDIEKAETWLERMLSDGLQADEVSYSSVIKACVQKGELDLAGYWLERMAAAGLKPNEVTYNTVAGACLAAGDKDRLAKWQEMLSVESGVSDPSEIKGVSHAQRPTKPSECTATKFEEALPPPGLQKIETESQKRRRPPRPDEIGLTPATTMTTAPVVRSRVAGISQRLQPPPKEEPKRAWLQILPWILLFVVVSAQIALGVYGDLGPWR